MSGPPLIRRGEAADLPGVSAIQAASPEAAQWPPGDYVRCDFRVAVMDNRLAGFLAARALAEDECEILNVAVSPEFRRKGVAKALVRSFLESVQGSVFLEVRASNTAARELYKSLGFQELTLRRDYYDHPPEPAIVMKFHS